jgi:hypothetical protein
MAEQTQTQLTEAQAIVVVEQGVRREVRKDSERTLDYCKDAVKLQGYNVRKLAQKVEARADLAREKAEAEGTEIPASFNADSYQSNVSNASGVMALFAYDIDAFAEWLKTAESKSLSKIFKQFRELFTEPKAPKAKSEKDEADGNNGKDSADTPLIQVVLSALPHLTVEERAQVIEACFAIDAPVSEEADEVVAA